MNNPVRAQPTQGPTPGILSDSKFVPATVADIMTKDVVTLTTDQTVADAISSLASHQFHHVVITDGNGNVVGIVSDRDILRRGGTDARLARRPRKPHHDTESHHSPLRKPLACCCFEDAFEWVQQPAGSWGERRRCWHPDIEGCFVVLPKTNRMDRAEAAADGFREIAASF